MVNLLICDWLIGDLLICVFVVVIVVLKANEAI
jgi:hypothetical protein